MLCRLGLAGGRPESGRQHSKLRTLRASRNQALHGIRRAPPLQLCPFNLEQGGRREGILVHEAGGLSLIKLILATTIIAILSAIAVPLYAKRHTITRAAHEKVAADHGPIRGTGFRPLARV